MEKVILTVDSGVGTIDSDVDIVPVQILCDNDSKEYLDGIDIDNNKIINDLEKGYTYKTASPPVSYYEEIFTRHLQEGKDIVHLSMSSGISEGSYNLSNMIANMVNEEYSNKVHVVDTLTGASGGILISRYAKNLIDSGLSITEVVNKLEEFKRYLKTTFFVPNPDGFIRSGRNKTDMSTADKAKLILASAAVRTGFKFKVDFNSQGNLVQDGVLRGKTNNCFKQLVANIINNENIESYDNSLIVIGNVLKDKVEMDEVKDYIKSLQYFKELIEKDFPSAVAAYGCRDLCGISLIKKMK